MRDEVLSPLHFRYACKRFNPSMKIDKESLETILEAGRLSPSSFGMEPWRFLVVQSDAMKQKLRPLCWNQPQITDASCTIIYLSAIENLKPQSGTPSKRFARRPLPPEKIERYNHVYADFVAPMLEDDDELFSWSARQSYIALANMMSIAAMMQIDSCPIEGFEKQKVEKLLGLDPAKWQVTVMCAFGYRNEKQPPRKRLELSEIARYL